MKQPSRFVVYGQQDDSLIENHTDDFDHAVMLWDIMRCADWKSRVWDNHSESFVAEHVLELALKYLDQ